MSHVDDKVVKVCVLFLLLGCNIGVAVIERFFAHHAHLALLLEELVVLELLLNFLVRHFIFSGLP